MAKRLERQQVITLRQQGLTYSEIRSQLNIAKSTLSNWLKDYPLTEPQLFALESNREKRIMLAREKTTITKQLKYKKRLADCFIKQRNKWLPLSERELFLAGIFLYWGEGGKTHRGQLSISNTDPGVLKFSLLWMTKALEIPKEKIRVLLHLYKDMAVNEAVTYWSAALNLSQSQFTKPYIKKSLRSEVDYKGHGHGTCMLQVSNTLLRERVMMTIRAMDIYANEHILAL